MMNDHRRENVGGFLAVLWEKIVKNLLGYFHLNDLWSILLRLQFF